MGEFKKELPRRSRKWKIVVAITTLIIIAAIIYFIVEIFNSNPLIGEWKYGMEDELELKVNSNGTLSMEMNEIIDGQIVDAELKMNYEVDTNEKSLMMYATEETVTEILDETDGQVDEQEIRQYVSTFATKWSYSIEEDVLQLIKLDSGESIAYQRN